MAPKTKSDRCLVQAALESGHDSETARNMLRYAFPHALPTGEESHQSRSYQLEVLGLVDNHLRTMAAGARAEVQAEGVKVEEAQGLVTQAEAALEAAANAVEKAIQEQQSRETSVQQLQAKLGGDEARHEEIRKRTTEFLSAREATESARTQTKALLEGLESGEPAPENLITELVDFLQEFRAEKSLMVSVPAAFRAERAARSPFDNFAIDAARDIVSQKVAELDKDISANAGEVAHAQAETLGAWAIVSCTQDDKKAAEDAASLAKAQVQEAKDAKTEAAKHVKEQKAALSTRLVEQTLAETRQAEVEQAQAAFERLRAPPAPVEQPVADRMDIEQPGLCQPVA